MTRIIGVYTNDMKELETIEMNVKSEIWGKTIAVVDVKSYLTGRRLFPCGDGCDYRLTDRDVKDINGIIIANKGKR